MTEESSLDRGPLFRFLADDHIRLAELLKQAGAKPGKIDYRPYAEIRARLLKHIAIGKNFFCLRRGE